MIRLPFTNFRFFILLLIAVSSAYCQEKSYQLNFSKDNISWIWLGRLNVNHHQGSKSLFFLNNDYNGNLFRETRFGNKWKDENKMQSGWQYRLWESVQSTVMFRSHLFSDENANVEFRKYLVMEKLSYSPGEKIQIAPALGWAVENIYGFDDQGWYTQVDLDVRDYNLAGYINHSQASSSIYFFPGRRNQEHRYYTAFSKQFSQYAADSIRVGYEFRDNSYYISGGSNLENVESNSRFLYNRLQYHFSRKADFEIETRLRSRDVNQSNASLLNHRKELDFLNRISFQHKGNSLQNGIAFTTSQITNRTLRSNRLLVVAAGQRESRTDLTGLQSAFNIFSNWKISRRDQARLTFSYTKYEYTTPDTTQRIDEDDQRFMTHLNYRHRFSRYFLLKFDVNLYLYHQIYIHSERSANNNWNRIFQLAPSFHFRLFDRLQHTNQIRILANYTVYDFEEFLPEVRSYIHRKLIYTDSLSMKISRGLKLVTVYELEKEDNGTFYQDLFAQQINRELKSHFLDLSLVYLRLHGLKLVTGLNWYWRREWSFLSATLGEERTMTRDYLAFSPRITFFYNLGKNLLLHLNFSRKMYRDINIARQYYSTGQVNLKYLF